MSVSRHSKNLTSFASLYCQSQLFLSLSVGFGCLLKDSLVLGAVFEICDLHITNCITSSTLLFQHGNPKKGDP